MISPIKSEGATGYYIIDIDIKKFRSTLLTSYCDLPCTQDLRDLIRIDCLNFTSKTASFYANLRVIEAEVITNDLPMVTIKVSYAVNQDKISYRSFRIPMLSKTEDDHADQSGTVNETPAQ